MKLGCANENERYETQDSRHTQAHSSARGIVKRIRDIRSGGLSLILLCAGANRI